MSHGVPRAAFEALAARGLSVIDATCPFVSRIHKLVAEAEQEGRQPAIIGQKNHPEVLAIAGWCAHPLVFETAEELENWLGGAPERPYLPISMVFQTTSTKAVSYTHLIASEFIAMASHLMVIKTKMLLSLSDREEALSEMELLIRSLEERQRKEALDQVRTRCV